MDGDIDAVLSLVFIDWGHLSEIGEQAGAKLLTEDAHSLYIFKCSSVSAAENLADGKLG